MVIIDDMQVLYQEDDDYIHISDHLLHILRGTIAENKNTEKAGKGMKDPGKITPFSSNFSFRVCTLFIGKL